MQQKSNTQHWNENCEIDETAMVAAFVLALNEDSNKTAIMTTALFLVYDPTLSPKYIYATSTTDSGHAG